jgi:hypothetical protein
MVAESAFWAEKPVRSPPRQNAYAEHTFCSFIFGSSKAKYYIFSTQNLLLFSFKTGTIDLSVRG